MLLRSIATVGGYTLLSRVVGFLRDLLFAALLGAGPVADAFVVAFRLPNLFRALSAEGAFSAAFVPIYARLLVESRIAAQRFAEDTLAVMVAVLTVIVIIGEAGMPWIMRALATGFADQPQQMALVVELGRITFPYLLLISLTAFQGAVLNAHSRFAAMAAAPILLNLALLAVPPLLLSRGIDTGHAFAWAVIAGGILQFLFLAVICQREGIRLVLPKPSLSPEVRRLFRRMGPGVVGAGVTQLNLVVGTILATLIAEGAVSYLYYADRLSQLPLGVVGTAVGTALLPLLSSELKTDPAKALASHNRAIEAALLLALPAATGLVALAEPIVIVLFERGAFGRPESIATAQAVAAYALGLPAFVLVKALSPGFLAREDTATPVKLGMVAIAVNLALNLALMKPLGHIGIALGTSAAAWVNVALLWSTLARRGHFSLDTRSRRTLPRLVLVTLAMGIVVWAAKPYLPVGTLGLGLLIALGGAVFGSLVLLSGAASLADLRRALRR
ncbi:MAG: murein biosynthesis integral membrane protein MurJ [Alphaproteobacteria bacterium]|nr:murein biosynthesis integral membrane protein MurJ [Alphaproteobacteria bacterium]